MKNKSIFRNGLALGHIVECFDNTLYGYFSVILAPIFFPTQDAQTQILASFGAFAAGYLTKPLGAFIFGLLGDKTNRSLPLILCIGLVGFPTLMIGLLPSYEMIGAWAPFTLIICRLLQGFFFGGEFAGANVFIYETFPKDKLGRCTGELIASGVMGAVLATVTGAIVMIDIFPTWSWRIPFIVGGMLAFLAFFLRKNLQSPELTSKKETSYLFAIKELLSDHKQTMFFCLVLSGLSIVPLNLATVYANKVFTELGFTSAECLTLNCLTMIINAAILIPYGRMADKITFPKMIEYGCLLNMFVAYPSFLLLTHGNVGAKEAILFLFLLIGAGAIINGCAFPYMASFFPKRCRYTGLAISYTVGIALISGTAPLVATLLTTTFNSGLMVAWYIIALSVLTLVLHRLIIIPRESTLLDFA